jgi:hypothetical protein
MYCLRSTGRLIVISAVCLTLFGFSLAQSFNASLTGVVADATGAVIPGVEVSLTRTDTGAQSTFVTDDQGRYSFPNLTPGVYELRAMMTGFKEYVQTGIELAINAKARLNVTLQIGEVTETVQVMGSASQLNFDNATREEGISPDTLHKLPLLVSGTVRSAANFAVLMPGVSTGGGNSAFDARINGGIQSGDEAVLDGVSMQQGTMSQSGMISISQDFPFSPDMVSEVKVLTSNYEPQYGGTAGATIIAETKSGTNEFHGSGFWFHRNSVLNARQFGRPDRPFNLQHNFGANVGGPVRLPGAWSDSVKTYFYFNHEQFRINGGASAPLITIPTLKMREGDFSEWRDTAGNLIPIYDPLTLRANPNFNPAQDPGPNNLPYLRDQFMGCDGNSPNVICSNRFANSWALAWLKHLPNPTFGDRFTQNYQAPPVPDILLANTKYYFWRIDTNIGDKNHIYLSSWSQWAPANYNSTLPRPIASESITDPQNSWVNRLNITRTYSPNLLQHFSIGYLNRNEGYGSMNQEFVDEFPKVPGVAGYSAPPQISFSDGYQTFGNSTGDNKGNVTTRPTVIGNTLFTWVKGPHTLKWGSEYRDLGQNFHDGTNLSGSFFFGRGPTSVRGIPSGHPLASFLLEQVSSGSAAFRTVDAHYARQKAIAFYGGDTWKFTPKWTFNYGVRWDTFTPAVEKYDRLAFFDPTLMNPVGRLGALAFADEFRARTGRRHPEETWKGGWAPRLGLAYAMNDKTVVRTGYGIFYHQAYCPGWGGCMSLDGYNANPSFSGGLDGLEAAFILSQGFPQNFEKPPFLEADFRNGQGLLYRPFEANRRAYSQQWNLTVERAVTRDFMTSFAYVGNAGRRLPSFLAPINALNPSLLSMGENLRAVFEPGQTELHGVPAPYAGWAEQMTGCSPTVAQAMLPYPQYCDRLQGINENAGVSSYHSFQAKVDKRFSAGTFLLVSYTLQKLLTTSGQTNEAVGTSAWGGFGGVISPFERQRAKALANDDVPQILSVSFIYELPWRNEPGVLGALIGNWSATSIFRYSSGLPFYFRGSNCNIPGQFRMGCLPNYNPSSLFAQSKGDFDPGQGPLFNADAFEGPVFNYTQGTGSVITNERGFAFYNHDFSLVKNNPIAERANFQFRAEFFNLWNWHTFTSSGTWGGQAFNTGVGSANFGTWNGSVSAPRTIQFSARLEF